MQNEENTTTSEKPKAGRFLDECSLRDYFAAKATEDDVEFWMNALGPAGPAGPAGDVWPSRESCKFAYADAMLAARNRAGEEGRS